MSDIHIDAIKYPNCMLCKLKWKEGTTNVAMCLDCKKPWCDECDTKRIGSTKDCPFCDWEDSTEKACSICLEEYKYGEWVKGCGNTKCVIYWCDSCNNRLIDTAMSNGELFWKCPYCRDSHPLYDDSEERQSERNALESQIDEARRQSLDNPQSGFERLVAENEDINTFINRLRQSGFDMIVRQNEQRTLLQEIEEGEERQRQRQQHLMNQRMTRVVERPLASLVDIISQPRRRMNLSVEERNRRQEQMKKNYLKMKEKRELKKLEKEFDKEFNILRNPDGSIR